ncbi:ParB/RepB/Spo0J family partition protein [Microvirga sp. W0021]|uniref:ParB/RepB/Spo0J family partition protein n=1 Tax=Hohaiivirga grylli TaxID=3133970 RepID=A0ABV0BHL6_9HYPH
MADENKPRLGKGLAALIGEVGDEFGMAERKNNGSRKVAIEFLRPNPRNPRKYFDDADLTELAESVKQRGIIQPILVRAIPKMPDAYEIVAGERRWRAAQRAGLHEVPIVIADIDDKTSLEYAIIENVQRSDLNPMEEAAGYQRLMDDFGYNSNEIGQTLAKSRSYVVNTVRLLNLPAGVQEMVVDGRLSAGQARAILACKDPEQVAQKVLNEGLTVREIERIAQDEAAALAGENRKPSKPKNEKDADTRALERALEDVLGLGVTLNHKGDSGELRIRYKTLDQLDGLCRRLRDGT